jgi:hypothetical protein
VNHSVICGGFANQNPGQIESFASGILFSQDAQTIAPKPDEVIHKYHLVFSCELRNKIPLGISARPR